MIYFFFCGRNGLLYRRKQADQETDKIISIIKLQSNRQRTF